MCSHNQFRINQQESQNAKREFYYKVNEEVDSSDTFDCVCPRGLDFTVRSVVTKKLDKLDYFWGVLRQRLLTITTKHTLAYEHAPVFAMCTNHDEFCSSTSH